MIENAYCADIIVIVISAPSQGGYRETKVLTILIGGKFGTVDCAAETSRSKDSAIHVRHAILRYEAFNRCLLCLRETTIHRFTRHGGPHPPVDTMVLAIYKILMHNLKYFIYALYIIMIINLLAYAISYFLI